MTTTKLLYEAAGSPTIANIEKTDGNCWLCGEMITEGAKRSSVIADTFVDHDKCACSDSEYICPACTWCFSEQDEALTKKVGKFWTDKKTAITANQSRIEAWQKKNKTTRTPTLKDIGIKEVFGGFAIPQRMRTYSHFVVGGKWLCLSKAQKDEMRKILFDPPAGEWIGIIADSGKKHIIFRAPIAYGSNCIVQFEEQLLEYGIDEIKYLHADTFKLYELGFSKGEIESGEYQSNRIVRAGFNKWKTYENKIKSKRGSRIFGLALFLTTKGEAESDE